MSFFAADDLAVLYAKLYVLRHPLPPHKKKTSQPLIHPLTTKQWTKYPGDLEDVSRCFKAK
jgi:hypothetical protein